MQAGGEAAAAQARRSAKLEAEQAAQANLAKARQQVNEPLAHSESKRVYSAEFVL
jgi:hypothetical protein